MGGARPKLKTPPWRRPAGARARICGMLRLIFFGFCVPTRRNETFAGGLARDHGLGGLRPYRPPIRPLISAVGRVAICSISMRFFSPAGIFKPTPAKEFLRRELEPLEIRP